MNDSLAIEYALYRAAQSYSQFQDVNIVLYRNFLAAKVQAETIWMTPAASGKTGVGIIVQLPQVLMPKPNGLQREREFSISVFEEPNYNFTPAAAGFGGGTFRDAIDWADIVLDFMWNFYLWRSSGLIPQVRALVPDERGAEAGIIGVKAVCVMRQERKQPPRAATPAIAVDGENNVTLTVTDGSAIYYTTDGFSYPSPKTDGTLSGEQAAQLYQGPFNVVNGTVVMAAAFQAGLLPSQTANVVVD